MKVFLLGATGYVGSHVGKALVRAGHEITGFVRDATGATRVRSYGATAWVGDLSDQSRVHAEACAADATIFAPQLFQEEEYASVQGLLKCYRKTEKTFVFTSGTAVFGQRTFGEWSDETFSEYDDFVCNKYLQRRRHTEIMVRAAADDGVRAMVIRPPAIWGYGVHAFVRSILESIGKTGCACYIGKGLNLYTHVHIEDLADLYRRALERGVAGALYHAAGGELNNRTLAEYVARVTGVQTRSITVEQAFDLWGSFAVLATLGVCSRSRSPRSRQELGWKPERTDLGQEILDGKLTPPGMDR